MKINTNQPNSLWLVLLLLVVFWLGARGLDADPIWFDEWWSIYNSGGVHYGPLTPVGIWNRVATEDPWQAPGFFMLLNAWAGVVGWEPPALRALSLFFGVLAVAWTYRLGRDMLSSHVGLYAAAIIGTCAFFVHYLHEMRVYTFFALLTAFAVWTYWRIIHRRREPSPWLWVGLLVGAVGLLYSQYFAAMPLMAIGLYHLLFVPKTGRWWKVVGVLALAGVLFLPWFGALLSGLDQAGEAHFAHKTVISVGDTFERIAYFFGNGSVVLALVVAGLSVRPRQRGVWQTWFFVVVTLALMLLVNLLVQIMTPARIRYLYGLWPLLGLLAGVGIDRLRRYRWASPLALSLWLAVGLSTSLDSNFIANAGLDGAGGQWHTFPWHVARDVFLDYAQPGDALILNVPDGIGRVPLPEHQIPEFYLRGSGVHIGVIGTQSTAEQDEEQIQLMLDFASESPRVWVASVPDRPSAVLPEFEAVLSESYGLCEAGISRPEYRFDLYTVSPVCCTPGDAPPLIRFGASIGLVGMEPLPSGVSDILPVILSWSIGDDVPPYTYSVALHVVDETDNLVAQTDYGLFDVAFSCQNAAIAVDHLPAGEYRLYVMVYAWASGERLPGEVAATGEQGDRLLVGTFEKS